MTQVVASAHDTYVSQAKASTNYTSAPTLGLRTGGGGNAYGFIQFTGLPTGSDVTISGNILRVFNTALWSGSVTLTAKQVTSKWTGSTLTYNNAPTVTATNAASVTKSGAAINTEWDVDITAITQAWAAGAPNYGIRLEVNTTAVLRVYAMNASGTFAAYKPTCALDWSGSPEGPTALNPDGGRQVSIANPTVTWVYSDPAGNTMNAYQLQTNTSDVWTSPAYDSGVVTSSLPQHTITTSVTVGVPQYGRVRQQNAAGKWSAYSATFTFGRTAKSTLTLTNPAVSPNNFVTELTPPITWTFTGTETKWQVFRPSPANGSVILADSGEQSGTDLSYTSPIPLAFAGGSEQVNVRVWDNVDRASTPGDKPYVEVSRVFTFAPGSITGGAVSSLDFTPDATLPFGKLTWTRATAPDSYTIVRDGVAVATDVAPGDLLVSGTSYAFSDTTASPRTSHTWRVDAVVNGVASTGSPTVTGTITPTYAWLLNPDDPTWWIALADQDGGSWSMGEESEMHEIRGSDRQVLIAESLRGYEGSFSGGLYTGATGLGSVTAQQLRDRAWDLKRNPTHTWRLVLADMNIPVVVRNVTVTPSPNRELLYGLSFEFFQQGSLPWMV